MISREIAYRYANALSQLGRSKEQLAGYADHLLQVVKLMESLPKLRQMLLGPQFGKNEKKRFLEITLGKNVDPGLMKFILFLIQKGRIQHLPEIAMAYKNLLAHESKVLEAKLITAVPINAGISDKLKAKLEKAYEKKILVEQAVDPEIIGGMIVLLDNQMMDCSVKNRLKSLKKLLQNAKVD